MAEIILLGTFHYPDRYDIFSDDVQKQIEEFTDKLAIWKPTKIAVEFPYKMQKQLEALYEKSKDYNFSEDIVLGNIERYGANGPFNSGNEIVQVAFRLAQKLNHKKLYGIDEEIELSDELFEKIATYMDMDKCFEKIGKLVEKADNIQELYAIHNSEEYIYADNGMYIDMNKVNLGNYEGSQLVLQWYERNLKIFPTCRISVKKGIECWC